MEHLFLSYKREDRPKTEALANALRETGWDVWWDERLEGGDIFDDVIEKQIVGAECLVVLWSDKAVKSNFVKDEVRFALEREVPVVAATIDDAALPVGFKSYHAVSLRDWSGDSRDPAFLKLAKSVARHATKLLDVVSPTRKTALLVAVSDYYEWESAPELHTGRANLREMRDLLSLPKCGWDSVEQLENPDCRKLQIELEKLFRWADPDHQVLLYFFGHIAVSADGRLYLCATDTQPDFLDATGIPVRSWLRESIDKSKTIRNHIIFDADYLLADASSPGSGEIDIGQQLHHQLGRGRGKHLISAVASIGAPIEKEGDETTPFVRHFTTGISTGAADENDDRVISVEEVCRYIRGRMAEENYPEQPSDWSFEIDSSELTLARETAGKSKPVTPLELNQLTVVHDHIVNRRVVPFLGNGIYGSGPLSPFQLSSALLEKAGLSTEDQHEVATAAQYLYEQTDDRTVFLSQFREILEAQMANVEATGIHSLLLKLDAPALIVSASYDFVLENRLAGLRPHVIVSHVLSSTDGDKNGKLMVAHRGETTDVSFCLSDELLLDETNDLVIYKILGSPFLNDLAEDPNIDTLVATETDHIKLLAQLRHDNSTVPTAFSVPLNTKFLVFIGYTLDFWHYRLIAHIFERYRGKKRYAVRVPVSPIETSCWESLGVKIIESNPAALAQILPEKIRNAE